MALPSEFFVPDTVKRVETQLRPLGPAKNRLRQSDALSYSSIEENFAPQLVAEVPVRMPSGMWRSIKAYNNLSPYNWGENELNILLMDGTCDYTPSPSETPVQEGQAMMQMAAVALFYMQEFLGAQDVAVGYNSSRWGFEKNVNGLQSIPTKFHPQVFSIPTDAPEEPLSCQPENVKRFVKGSPQARLVGFALRDMMKHDDLPFINYDSIEVDNRGLHCNLTENIRAVLEDKEFFPGLILPLHTYLEKMAVRVGSALTTMDFDVENQMIRSAFEGFAKPEEIYEKLQEPPKLLPEEDRLKRIESLRNFYPEDFIKYILKVNPLMKNRESVSENNRVRKGFGYALVIRQKGDNACELRVRPAIKQKDSIGGIVEVLDISLSRIENSMITENEHTDAMRRKVILANNKNLYGLSKLLNVLTLPLAA